MESSAVRQTTPAIPIRGKSETWCVDCKNGKHHGCTGFRKPKHGMKFPCTCKHGGNK